MKLSCELVMYFPTRGQNERSRSFACRRIKTAIPAIDNTGDSMDNLIMSYGLISLGSYYIQREIFINITLSSVILLRYRILTF